MWKDKQDDLYIDDLAIDNPVADLIGAGTIRLLSCAWLLSAEAAALLADADAEGAAVMRRPEMVLCARLESVPRC